MSDIQWGTVGEWTGFLAFLAAIGLLWHEMRERRDRITDQEKQQARLVYVELVSFGAGIDNEYMVGPRVHNDSDQPIYDVRAITYDGHGEVFGKIHGIGGEIIAPHGTGERNLRRNMPEGYTFGDDHAAFDISFGDADGRRWERRRDRSLRRLRG